MLITAATTLRPKVCFITSMYFVLVYVNANDFLKIIVVFQKNKIIYFYVSNITYSTVSMADREHSYD